MLLYMIGDRLKQVRKALDLNQEDFAALVGTTKQYVSQLESGRNKMPNGQFLEGWARAGRVRHEWLATGKGQRALGMRDEPEPEWSDVEGYAQAVGLNDGAEAQEYAETHSLKFRADSLARKRLRPSALAVMYGHGDSMEPRIHSGDAILFDKTDTVPRDGHIYVVMVPGAGAESYTAKRCEIIGDLILFKADNPRGDHNWRKPKRMDDERHPIKIVGRVRWIGSWEG